MATFKRHVLPFTAIVGQEDLKLALVLNVINPAIGGVLVRGERGTAKSTAVRALADLLPEIETVENCPFNCDPQNPALQCENCRKKAANGPLPAVRRKMPVVELPLGATEDRLIGALDIEEALKTGKKRLQPGLLGMANRGFLYVDEINLLDDYLVDLLLDAAALGANTIEREGVSFTHPARFILVGTMNPEEGDLRPQIEDRIGLCVDVRALDDPKKRVEIVRITEEFQENPEKVARRFRRQQTQLRRKIMRARRNLRKVDVPDEAIREAVRLAHAANTDGHRAEILITRTAKTLAAFQNQPTVKKEHIHTAARLVLPHRKKPHHHQHHHPPKPKKEQEENSEPNRQNPQPLSGFADVRLQMPPADDFPTPKILLRSPRLIGPATGRRTKAPGLLRGKHLRAITPRGRVNDVDLLATIRTALLEGKFPPQPDHLRLHLRRRKLRASISLLVDTSGSMGAMSRFALAKRLAINLLKEAYKKRDRVSVVTFGGHGAKVVLAPTSSAFYAWRHLVDVPFGGASPLASGLKVALRLLRGEKARLREVIPLIVLLSDGRANRPDAPGNDVLSELKTICHQIVRAEIRLLVCDFGRDFLGMSVLPYLVEWTGGQLVGIAEDRFAAEERTSVVV